MEVSPELFADINLCEYLYLSVLTDNTEPLADMLLSTSVEVHCNATKIWEVGPKERQTRDAQTKARNVKVRKERHYESKKQKASDRYRTFRGSQKGREGASKKIAYFFFWAALAADSNGLG